MLPQRVEAASRVLVFVVGGYPSVDGNLHPPTLALISAQIFLDPLSACAADRLKLEVPGDVTENQDAEPEINMLAQEELAVTFHESRTHDAAAIFLDGLNLLIGGLQTLMVQ
jgi:hypothetical protein